jgi:hypothetical protein
MSDNDNKRIYDELYKVYRKNLEKENISNGSTSSYRRDCWNACSKSVLLNSFIKNCKKNNISYDWYQWAIREEEELTLSGAIYSD